MKRSIFCMTLGLSALMAQDCQFSSVIDVQSTLQQECSFEHYIQNNKVELVFKAERYRLDLSDKNLTDLNGLLQYSFIVDGQNVTLAGLGEPLAINLENNRLVTLPPELAHIPILVELNLKGNQIIELPQDVGNISLELLNLDNNHLTSLPDSLGSLYNLKRLFIASNKLQSLPSTLGTLENLFVLNLSDNQLHELPGQIGNLAKLEWFNVGNNQLSTLPNSFGQLTNLKVLLLNHNNLQQAPRIIFTIDGMIKLDLSYNQIPELPEEIRNLKLLRSLNLTHNELRLLPETIGNLNYIEQLFVADNKLSAIPSSLSQLKCLHQMTLTGNPDLPAEISRLKTPVMLTKKPTALSTSSREAHNGNFYEYTDTRPYTYEDEIDALRAYKMRDASFIPDYPYTREGYPLPVLPSPVTGLVNHELGLAKAAQGANLQSRQGIPFKEYAKNHPLEITWVFDKYSLDLTDLNLVDIDGILEHKFIFEGSRVTLLELNETVPLAITLDYNLLTRFPIELAKIKGLVALSIVHNRLITIPTIIDRFERLVSLNLDENQLLGIPATIGMLSNLTKLTLCNNLIRSIPAEIGNLSKLSELVLSHNQIIAIPNELNKLNLKILYLEGNPITLPA